LKKFDWEKTGRYIVTFREGVTGANLYQPLVDAALEPMEFVYPWDTD
jgi:hypothetical protein